MGDFLIKKGRHKCNFSYLKSDVFLPARQCLILTCHLSWDYTKGLLLISPSRSLSTKMHFLRAISLLNNLWWLSRSTSPDTSPALQILAPFMSVIWFLPDSIIIHKFQHFISSIKFSLITSVHDYYYFLPSIAFSAREFNGIIWKSFSIRTSLMGNEVTMEVQELYFILFFHCPWNLPKR